MLEEDGDGGSLIDGRPGHTSVLVLQSGNLSGNATSSAAFTFGADVTLLTQAPLTISGQNASFVLEGLVLAPSIVLAGSENELFLQGQTGAGSIHVANGRMVVSDGSIGNATITVGDKSGEVATLQPGGSSAVNGQDVTLNSDGVLLKQDMDVFVDTLTFNGGTVDAWFNAGTLRANHFVARPVVVAGVPHVGRINSTIYLELSGATIFDCRAADGVADALIIDSLVNVTSGMIDKRGMATSFSAPALNTII